MGWIVIIFIILLVVIALSKSSDNKNIERMKSAGVIFNDDFVTYIGGGFPDVSGGSQVKLYIKRNRIILNFDTKLIASADDYFPEKTIDMDNVVNCEIKSEEQLQNDISIGRIMLLGIFAFGKQKNVVNNYTLITYKTQNDEEKHIILKSNNNEKIVRTIRNIKFGEVI